MEPFLLATIIFIALITLGFFVWFTVHKSKEKERLVLLEKGYDPKDIPDRDMISFPWLKWGCVVTSMVIGLFIGEHIIDMDGGSEIVMFLFGGIGLIIAHFVDKSNGKS